ncbi:hypothetical protein ACUUL3_07390 [Thiovibrio sp. JS02]
MTSCKSFFVGVINISLLLALFGCAQKTAQQTQEDELFPIKTIVLLPVEIAPDGNTSPSEKERAQLEAGQIAMNAILAEYFAGNDQINILTEGQRDALDKGFTRCRTTAAVNICRIYKADAVLLCTLHRYVEREGTEYSIISPATVAFDYKLVLAESGQTLCAGTFTETQKPLLDDMFQFFKKAKRGFKWLTAEALARDGVQQKLANCLYLQK